MKERRAYMKNQIAFEDHQNGMVIAKGLLDEGYVVMLSYEEQLLIVNYEWTPNHADRNDMVFMTREKYEEEMEKIYEEVMEDLRIRMN